MAKVDIGKLRKMIRKQPELAATLAFAHRVIVTNYHSLGDYMGFMVIGTEQSTPEIIISKAELRKFAQEVLAKTEDTVK